MWAPRDKVSKGNPAPAASERPPAHKTRSRRACPEPAKGMPVRSWPTGSESFGDPRRTTPLSSRGRPRDLDFLFSFRGPPRASLSLPKGISTSERTHLRITPNQNQPVQSQPEHRPHCLSRGPPRACPEPVEPAGSCSPPPSRRPRPGPSSNQRPWRPAATPSYQLSTAQRRTRSEPLTTTPCPFVVAQPHRPRTTPPHPADP